MLIHYKKSYEKIAMGLLSFIPSEKDIRVLQQTISRYEEEEPWQLFLWKDGEDVIGVIGIYRDEGSDEAVIKHLSVNPSYRAEGVGKKMICAVDKALGEQVKLLPSDSIKGYFDSCFQNNEEKETGI
ncbi:GNAT family N-acetyltransferase [Sporolactobacillus sp. Y61]|uniref:GNAT family N-acetyltransferase n=1 Tax=Sporolactobacillus sp. Y61 TaxID=3160863 RepID=A0AAU8IDN0_9BACL|nr:GNAT family N-acetyltransferase [Sporolactobacillus sp. THM19-2]RYL93193.1 GNAT family N-acetyltransferase [Sporolactobacillus sp. THM19-2]